MTKPIEGKVRERTIVDLGTSVSSIHYEGHITFQIDQTIMVGTDYYKIHSIRSDLPVQEGDPINHFYRAVKVG